MFLWLHVWIFTEINGRLGQFFGNDLHKHKFGALIRSLP
jgi:hypothetical protein